MPQVKLIDRTFNCDKERTKALWRHLIAHDNGVTNFHFEISAHLIDDEILEFLQENELDSIYVDNVKLW